MVLIVMLAVSGAWVALGRSASASQPPCAAVEAEVSAALEMAARCEQRVEALDLRSEYEQVFVNPDGTKTLVSAIAPQRVRQGDGSWREVDTSLHLRPDGSAVPETTLADVTFSAGGEQPLATWREDGAAFTMSWPGALPAPRIDGATAVYESVLPDVDLHATATVDGFTYALEVKTRAAAENPALRELTYPTSGDIALVESLEGVLELRHPSGALVAVADEALMWDSTQAVTVAGTQSFGLLESGEQAAETISGDAASSVAPGDLSKRAAVSVSADEGGLRVVADETLLTDPDVTFPLFIDPPFSKQRTLWAYTTSNGETNTTDTARVGRQPTHGQDRYRSLFSFAVGQMHGARVLSAKVTMVLDHSSSCGSTPVFLYRTKGIPDGSHKKRLSWNSYPLGSGASAYLDSWSGHANEAGGCGSIQPDMNAVFEGSALTRDLKTFVDGGWYSYPVGLCTCDGNDNHEFETARWKKFYTDKTYLIATYDLPPYKPVGLAFPAATDCYAKCSASSAVVRTTRPRLTASVRDPYGGSLLTAFEVRTEASGSAPIVVDNASARVVTSTPAVTKKDTSPAGTAVYQVPAGKLVHGTRYYWRATTRDENSLWSGWSPWYSFSVDTVAPAVPTVSSSAYPQKQWGETVGTSGVFNFTAASDVEDYRWSVDGGSATTTPVTQAGIEYTPATDMVHTMSVQVLDEAGNLSMPTEHQFWVSPVENKYAHWTFDESSGTTAADSGDPGAGGQLSPGTLGGPTQFVAGYLGNAVNFGGVNARVATDGPVVDTSESFTVMAWVRPADLAAAAEQTIMAQNGALASRFELQFRQDANGGEGGWCMTMAADSAGAGQVSACADGYSWGLPVEGEWVHLAGVYDAVTGKLRVYVMGDVENCFGEEAEADAPASWSALDEFSIGRGWYNGAGVSYWRGDIDEVRAYQRVLSGSEICDHALR